MKCSLFALHSYRYHSFVELVGAIAKVKPHKVLEKQPKDIRHFDTPAYKTFKRWVIALYDRYSPIPPNTTTIVFRFLFPDEDGRRKYGMQEAQLAQHLIKIFGVSAGTDGRGERLKNWKGEDAFGCLGDEVSAVMSATAHLQGSATTVALDRIDTLLMELASKCAFSDFSVHASTSTTTPRRSREDILASIYASLTPEEGAVVTQIILKDLRQLPQLDVTARLGQSLQGVARPGGQCPADQGFDNRNFAQKQSLLVNPFREIFPEARQGAILLFCRVVVGDRTDSD